MDRRMVKMIGFAGMLVLALGLIVTGEDKAVEKPLPKFADQPTGIQRLFAKQASNWVKIGDKLWSIEVMHQAKKRAKSKRGKAYQDESAPWFYEPIEGTRCRRVVDIYIQTGMKIPQDTILVSGTVIQSNSDGFVAYLSDEKRKAFMAFIRYGGTPLSKSTRLTLLIKPTGKEYFFPHKRLKNSSDKYDEFSEITFTSDILPVSPQELFDYHIAHQIKTFPVWRAKPNKERNGFRWINHPRQTQL